MSKVTYTKSIKTPSGITKTVSRGSTWSLVKLPVYVLLTWLLILGPIFAVQTTFENGQVVLADDFITQKIDLIQSGDYSLLFNNVNQNVVFPLHTNVTDNFEIEINLEFLTLPSVNDSEVFIYSNGVSNNGFHIFLINNYSPAFHKIVFLYPGNNFFHSTTHTLNVNTSYEIIASRINGVTSLQIDGVNQTLGNLGSGFQYPEIPTTESSLNKLTNSQSSNFVVNYLKISTNNTPIHEYLFNDGSGTILNDNIGNKDGTIINPNWQLTNVSSSTIITTRDYYQIMENARTAEYGNIFSSFEFLLNIPSTISNSKPLSFVGIQNTFSELWDTITNITSLPSLLPNLPMFGGQP